MVETSGCAPLVHGAVHDMMNHMTHATSRRMMHPRVNARHIAQRSRRRMRHVPRRVSSCSAHMGKWQDRGCTLPCHPRIQSSSQQLQRRAQVLVRTVHQRMGKQQAPLRT